MPTHTPVLANALGIDRIPAGRWDERITHLYSFRYFLAYIQGQWTFGSPAPKRPLTKLKNPANAPPPCGLSGSLSPLFVITAGFTFGVSVLAYGSKALVSCTLGSSIVYPCCDLFCWSRSIVDPAVSESLGCMNMVCLGPVYFL